MQGAPAMLLQQIKVPETCGEIVDCPYSSFPNQKRKS
jgi:hypothetical protein